MGHTRYLDSRYRFIAASMGPSQPINPSIKGVVVIAVLVTVAVDEN